jgi:hypothetical protein
MGRPLTGKTAEAHEGRSSVLDRFAAKNSPATGAIADHKESNRQIPAAKTEGVKPAAKAVASPKYSPEEVEAQIAAYRARKKKK